MGKIVYGEQLEYLKFNGNQYIDLGNLSLGDNTFIDTQIIPLEKNNYGFIGTTYKLRDYGGQVGVRREYDFGLRHGEDPDYTYIEFDFKGKDSPGKTLPTSIDTSNISYWLVSNPDENIYKLVIKISSSQNAVYNVTSKDPTLPPMASGDPYRYPFSSTAHFLLGGILDEDENEIQKAKMSIRYFRVRRTIGGNETILIDLIPARVQQNGSTIYGMWDKKTQRLFTSSGSAFVNQDASVVGNIYKNERQYLIQSNSTYYSYNINNNTITDTGISTLTKTNFKQNGVTNLPDADILELFPNNKIKLLEWDESKKHNTVFNATIDGTIVLPQILKIDLDLSHHSILGISNMTCTYEGNVLISYSYNNINYSSDYTVSDFLSLNVNDLYNNMNSNKHIYIKFKLMNTLSKLQSFDMNFIYM